MDETDLITAAIISIVMIVLFYICVTPQPTFAAKMIVSAVIVWGGFVILCDFSKKLFSIYLAVLAIISTVVYFIFK